MTDTNIDLIRQEMQALRLELTAAISTGLSAVTAALAAITDAHHRAMLEQSQRNGTFADRDRVESIARNVHDEINRGISLNERVALLEARIQRNDDQTADLARSVGERGYDAMSRVTGYLVSGGFGLAAVLLAYLLTGHHP